MSLFTKKEWSKALLHVPKTTLRRAIH